MLETFIAQIVFTLIVQKINFKKHEKVSNDHDYCCVVMPHKDNKILKNIILALEVVFSLNKANPDIKDLQGFSHTFLYSAYPDDAAFFLRNEKLATEVIKTFGKFSLYSGIKINNKKSEIASDGVKKGVKVALSGMEYIDSTSDVIKILYIYFSYNKNFNKRNNSLIILWKYKIFWK